MKTLTMFNNLLNRAITRTCNALCDRYYQTLYKQVHTTGCGAMPKACQQYTRHSPNAVPNTLKIACSRSDCARTRTYFSQYFMVKSRNIATFTPEYRPKHVSTHARNRENAHSTADYHLKWLSWKAKLMKPL